MSKKIEKTFMINAPLELVWDSLTDTKLMQHWMGIPEMNLKIITDWKEGKRIVIKGFHNVRFENKGKILKFKPKKIIKYNYLSSISRLPEKPENYTSIEFALMPTDTGTEVKLIASNFPTEIIYKHVDLYWRATTEKLRTFAQNRK